MVGRRLAIIFMSLDMEKASTSTWFALRNPVFRSLWLASVLSGTFVSAQDIAATWLMHNLGASSLLLSLMATAAAAPFFLFTLPAGSVADIVNRRAVILCAVLWQGGCSALLALGAWTRVIEPSSVLICIFVLGIGLAFSSPVWGAIVPDLVTKDELPSAITLGGVQLNLSGIVGPAIGGLLLPLLGAPLVISINALMFLVVALAVLQWKPGQAQLTGLRENFTESFISSLRYARNSPRMRTVLFRDLAFALVISIVPALLPVVALKEMHLSASQLGVVLSCVGIGSLAGAVFVLPYLRQRTSPNAITSISMAILVAVLFTLALLRELPVLMTCATLAGAAWALAGSELWVAGQRVMPGWVRGRMNAFQIMLGQGGMALGAASWGTGVAHAGLDLTFAAAAVVALAVLVMGYRFSINFGVDPSLDAAPRSPLHDFPEIPSHEEGPVTVTIEYSIAEEDRDRFRDLMQEVQATCRRNGAFHCRLDECLEHPGKFRLEFIVSTWAEHLRQNMRMTVDEARVFDTVWEMHAGDSEPMVRHYVATQKCVHLHGYGFCGRTFTDTSSLSRPKLESSTSSSRA
jgi:MFS family permease